MKRLASYSFVVISLLIGISILSTMTLAQADWRQIPIRPLHPFQPKQPKRIQLPNGMVIFLEKEHHAVGQLNSLRLLGLEWVQRANRNLPPIGLRQRHGRKNRDPDQQRNNNKRIRGKTFHCWPPLVVAAAGMFSIIPTVRLVETKI